MHPHVTSFLAGQNTHRSQKQSMKFGVFLDEANIYLRNVGNHLGDYMVSQPKRQECEPPVYVPPKPRRWCSD